MTSRLPRPLRVVLALPGTATRRSTVNPFAALLSARLLQGSVGAYLAAISLGVVMRLALAGIEVDIPFDHLLHAHSHTLYFGWAGLVLLVGGQQALSSPGWLLRLATLAVGVLSAGLWAVFLAQGYAPLSIAVSTVVMLVWYLAVAAWWRQAPAAGMEVAAFRAGLAYTVLASCGVWTLAALRAGEAGVPFTEALAVHFFLNGFAGFFLLGSIALLALEGRRWGIRPDPATLLRVVRWWVPLWWLTFPLAVEGGGEVDVLGPLARGAALALLYPTVLLVRHLWSMPGAITVRRLLRWAGGWLGVTMLMQMTVAVGGSGVLAAGGRQGVLIAIHALLAGYVTTILAISVTHRLGAFRPAGLLAHQLALTVMIAGLAGSMLHAAVEVVAALGAGGLLLAGLWWGGRALVRSRPPPEERCILVP